MLIVDDEATLRTVLAAVYKDAGFEVRTSASAEDALTALGTEPCDVLLVDKNLPAMNGIDLAREALERGLIGAAVMITGYPSTASLIEAINVGIRSYLVKPFRTLDDAVKEVRGVLDSSPRRTAIGPVALRRHLDGSAPLRPPPPALVILADLDLRERVLGRLGAGARAFGAVEIGLAALSSQLPDVIAADRVADLLRLLERAPRACGCYVGPPLSFDDARRLMRASPVLVLDADSLRGEGPPR
jgi:DNA-binding NarL/FixJ family response regulator